MNMKEETQRARLYLIDTVKQQTQRCISRVLKNPQSITFFFWHRSYKTLTQTQRWNLTFQSRVVSLSLRAHPSRPAGARPMESNVSSHIRFLRQEATAQKDSATRGRGQTPTLSSPPPAGSRAACAQY